MRAPALAGALTALAAGAVMVGLTASAGRLVPSLPAVAAFTGPLVAAGLLFGILVEAERIRPGFGPGILFWSVGFAAARLFQQAVLGDVEGMWGFIAYQLIVGSAFGLGYILLFRQILTGLERAAARRNRSGAEAPP